MKKYRVEVALYVEDDELEGALMTAQSILEEAGGSDRVPRTDGTFGFALGPLVEEMPDDV